MSNSEGGVPSFPSSTPLPVPSRGRAPSSLLSSTWGIGDGESGGKGSQATGPRQRFADCMVEREPGGGGALCLTLGAAGSWSCVEGHREQGDLCPSGRYAEGEALWSVGTGGGCQSIAKYLGKTAGRRQGHR